MRLLLVLMILFMLACSGGGGDLPNINPIGGVGGSSSGGDGGNEDDDDDNPFVPHPTDPPAPHPDGVKPVATRATGHEDTEASSSAVTCRFGRFPGKKRCLRHYERVVIYTITTPRGARGDGIL